MPPFRHPPASRDFAAQTGGPNDRKTAEGQEIDKAAPKTWRGDAAAEKAEAFRKGQL